MGNQVHPSGARYDSNGNRFAMLTGNQRVAGKHAHITCDMDPRWRKERKYQRLFFLDEATALAFGHRPCNRCRKSELKAFRAAWERADLGSSKVVDIDQVIDRERGRPHMADASELPDGVMVERDGSPYLLTGGSMCQWSESGYGQPEPIPSGPIRVLTPAAVVKVLAAGYRPVLHPSVPVTGL